MRSHRVPRVAPFLLALPALALSGCAIVRQDEVGVKRTLGRVADDAMPPGAKAVFPGVSGVIRLPARTVNREVRLELPSKEGLNIVADVSILYRIKPAQAPDILRTAGQRFEDVLILPVFRSAAADVSAKFLAKDMYSSERGNIERGIKEQMMTVLGDRGFVVEAVLMKSILLPAGLAQAVEDKLAAEQRAEQMRFVLERERQEAERKRVEAAGIRDAQQIISEGLNPLAIAFQSIDAFRALANSPNAKVILTDGRTPFLINPGAIGEEGGATANLRPAGSAATGIRQAGRAVQIP